MFSAITQVDEFEVEACIGDLKYIKIGHDNSGPGPGWHLQVKLLTLLQILKSS